jgi:hypothetical protein
LNYSVRHHLKTPCHGPSAKEEGITAVMLIFDQIFLFEPFLLQPLSFRLFPGHTYRGIMEPQSAFMDQGERKLSFLLGAAEDRMDALRQSG